MKVKVSYTIDLEEIPNKVREIVEKNRQALEEISTLSEALTAGDLGAKSLSDLSRMKQLSEDMTERYSDCESILTGFLQAVFAPPQEQTETQESLSDDDNS